ncbi:MAG TPA: lysophospholipid acyltransferase family protein [Gemmatimonadaceae bacterium]
MIPWILVTVAKLLTGAQVVRPLPAGPPRQRVFFANHTSHLDFVVLWAALPKEIRRRTRPVGGRDYWGTSALRRYIAENAFNAILIDRSKTKHSPEQAAAVARAQIERIAAEMGDHYSIIVFPEGTRGSGERVGPFKSGLYHLCRLKPGLELVPVYLANMNRILPKGEIVPVPMVGSVIFGDPLRMEEGEDKETFLTRTREAVVRLRGS